MEAEVDSAGSRAATGPVRGSAASRAGKRPGTDFTQAAASGRLIGFKEPYTMATRSRTTFQKRQKEIARMEKQREKAAKRMQRKMAGREPAQLENQPSEDTGEPTDVDTQHNAVD